MTPTDIAPRIARAGEDTAPVVLASWPARVGALGLDLLPGGAVLVTTALVALSVPLHGAWWWTFVCIGGAAVLWMGFNRVLLPSIGGNSLGRRTFGIILVRRAGSAVGPARLLLRDVAHLLDTAPVFLGWLWPLRDRRRRTFADMVSGTEMRAAPESERVRRPIRRATVVVLTAAAVCVAAAAASVTVVALQDRSVTDTSAEISAQGPHIVEQILNYHPDSVQADFERAQSLVTDTYRRQLSAQQQAVLKAGPVRNEYWVTNASVLNAARGRATMLLFLQGQRGAAPDQRYLTASLRVSFVQTGSAPWQVGDLTVVTSPPPVKAAP